MGCLAALLQLVCERGIPLRGNVRGLPALLPLECERQSTERHCFCHWNVLGNPLRGIVAERIVAQQLDIPAVS